MQLTFLGTADAWCYPDAFGTTEWDEQARALGGPSLRKHSAALVNDDLLIDLGPDVVIASMQHGVPLAGLRYCLQTHEHSDHLAPGLLLARGQTESLPTLHFHGSPGAIARVGRTLAPYTGVGEGDAVPPEALARLHLAFRPVEPFETFAMGPYRVQAVRANHDPEHITAMLYAVERDGRSLFYATDTGEVPEASWAALRGAGHRFNLVAMDHTFGVKERGDGHMNAAQFLEQVARMRDENLLAPDARVFATHIASHSNPPHPELVTYAAARGYEIAHDGLTVAV